MKLPGRTINEFGNIYGFLKVVAYAGSRRTKHAKKAMWLCECSCPHVRCKKQVIVSGAGLRTGHTTSCTRGRCKKPGESHLNTALINYKKQAKKREFRWEIADDIATALMLQSCHYCGAPPSHSRHSENQELTRNGWAARNGIDRLDNNRGYSVDNCVSCCATCNMMKKSMAINQFVSYVSRIVSYMSSSGSLTKALCVAVK